MSRLQKLLDQTPPEIQGEVWKAPERMIEMRDALERILIYCDQYLKEQPSFVDICVIQYLAQKGLGVIDTNLEKTP